MDFEVASAWIGKKHMCIKYGQLKIEFLLNMEKSKRNVHYAFLFE